MDSEKSLRYQHNFTAWLLNELRIGQKSLITYLPFIPAIGSAVYGYLTDNYKFLNSNLDYSDLLKWSILFQVIIVFCILIYQIYWFTGTETNGLAKTIKILIKKKNKDPETQIPQVIFDFTHTDSKNSTKSWENFKRDFKTASRNILYFKIAWIILWLNWFCYYIALLVEAHSSALFDFFMITETLCFAACYFRLSYHYESKTGELQQYWWAIIIVAMLFALGIFDQSIGSFTGQLLTSVVKALFACTFLGLLVGTLLGQVYNAPNWLKMTLFIYVALQPMLFAVHEVPQHTKQEFLRTLNYQSQDKIDKDNLDSLLTSKAIVFRADQNKEEVGNVGKVVYQSIKTFQILEILTFNLCLAFKYLLMFYFMWLLFYDHMLIYYMRTQGEQNTIQARRKDFERTLNQLVTKPETPQ